MYAEEIYSTEGKGHDNLWWPSFEARLNETHRETRRSGKYEVKFESGDRKKKWGYETSSLSRYHQFNINDLWILEIPNIGSMSPKKKSSFEKN
jgi:hypothetical protein